MSATFVSGLNRSSPSVLDAVLLEGMSECAIGRYLTRPQDGEWMTPCPVPAESIVPFPVPTPLYFCPAHHKEVMDKLWALFESAGLIDHDIVMGPAEEFDEIAYRLRQQE